MSLPRLPIPSSQLLRRLPGAALVLGLCLVSLPSHAANLRVGIGADYWLDNGGLFQATLGLEAPLGRGFSVGGRFGALLATQPNTLGVPVDLLLHARLGRSGVYLEGAFGPWLLFQGPLVRGHAAFGFGFEGNAFNFGLEVGWLDPSPLIGLRLGARF